MMMIMIMKSNVIIHVMAVEYDVIITIVGAICDAHAYIFLEHVCIIISVQGRNCS